MTEPRATRDVIVPYELLNKLAEVHRGWCNYCGGNVGACESGPPGSCSLRDVAAAIRKAPISETEEKLCARCRGAVVYVPSAEAFGADPAKLREEAALLPGLKEALKWKPNTPQLENAMTYAWESALKSFISAIEKNAALVPSSARPPEGDLYELACVLREEADAMEGHDGVRALMRRAASALASLPSATRAPSDDAIIAARCFNWSEHRTDAENLDDIRAAMTRADRGNNDAL